MGSFNKNQGYAPMKIENKKPLPINECLYFRWVGINEGLSLYKHYQGLYKTIYFHRLVALV